MKIILFSEISLDGKLTVGNCSSKELLESMSEKEIELIQQHRNKYDAILVGSETIKIDNPNLTCRLEHGVSPIRVILSSGLNFSFNENVFIDENRTVLVTSSNDEEKLKKITELNKEVLLVSATDLKDMRKIVCLLEDKLGIKSLIVEGGGSTNWSFAKYNLFDEIHLLQFPVLVGGKNTTSLVDGEGFQKIDLCVNYQFMKVEQYGTNLYLTFTKK
ncbi:RibD family protein [Enterococcus rivorum]|uniref:Bacterial bifunctional deaminase-reductase C-terminal domain-containing protein n=1 Tax=Enterococcus rivorum TaxID=762845 RepID=A0A1E5KWI2_9ENTE|nr:RibD family protein [Enterococcus rivorum]MBP2100483.1 5-amino-6-(5-phosphoribosylamino)uracil reductase [Enterococcus rivorum]OEH82158.1 hypothetical protein BCR26_14260 [Enterococcus rivorum]